MLNIVTKEDGLQLEPHDLQQIASVNTIEQIQQYIRVFGNFSEMHLNYKNVLIQILHRNFKAKLRDLTTGADFFSLFNKTQFFHLLPLRVTGQFDNNNSLIVQCENNPSFLLRAKIFNFHAQSLQYLDNCENWKTFSKETSILQGLNHEFITSHHDSYACSTHAMIFTEFCDYGPLHRHLGKLSLNMIRLWFIQTAKAVRYLHFNQIVHRNISTHTIHVRENLSIALGDFDQAENIANDYNMVRVLSDNAAWGFVAPEILNANQGAYVEGYKADAYSVGAVFLCLATEESDPRDAFAVVDSGIRVPYLDEDKALDLTVKLLLRVDPNYRPNIIEVLQTPDCLRAADELLDDEVDEGFVED